MSSPRHVSIAFQTDKSPDEYITLAGAAEAAGFDGISVFADLGFQPPWQALALMARQTERVRLGPACVNPFTTHPIDIAANAAMLDLIAGGRTYVGITKGTWLSQLGIEQRAVPAALRDTAAIIRQVLAENTDGYAGKVFRLDPGFILAFERPRRAVPLLVGAWGPKAVAVAGATADELKVGGTANADLVAVMRNRLAAGAEPVGRDSATISMAFGAVTVVDEDGDAARRLARTEVAMYLAVLADLDPTVTVPADVISRVRGLVAQRRHEEAGRLIPDELLDRFAFAGTPGEVAVHARRLFDAGLDRVEFGTPHGIDPLRGIELLAAEVLPALRAPA